MRISPVTGKRELHYPNKLRVVKMTVSFTLIVIAIIIVLLSVTGAIVYRAWARNYFGVCELPEALVEVCLGPSSDVQGARSSSTQCG